MFNHKQITTMDAKVKEFLDAAKAKEREIYEKKTNYVFGLPFPELRNGYGTN